MLSNLKKLAVKASFALACSGLVFSAQTMASAPMVKTPAPGYFRLMLGNYEITALSDGTIDLPVGKLLNQPPEKTTQALAQAFLKEPLETSVNGFLINTGTKLILVDTGAGSLIAPTLGKFVANLKASGYEPSQIDDIYLTHLHTDHAGGLLTNGAVTFPNATIHLDKNDADFWLSQANMDAAPDDKKKMYQNAMNLLAPYKSANKLATFSGNTELAPGIKSYSAYGHTAGHTVYTVESEGQKLYVLGDLIHVGAVQFGHPEVTVAFDTNQKEAEQQRNKFFTEAAKQGALVAAAHIQFPGLGHIQNAAKAYNWIPVNFTQMH